MVHTLPVGRQVTGRAGTRMLCVLRSQANCSRRRVGSRCRCELWSIILLWVHLLEEEESRSSPSVNPSIRNGSAEEGLSGGAHVMCLLPQR